MAVKVPLQAKVLTQNPSGELWGSSLCFLCEDVGEHPAAAQWTCSSSIMCSSSTKSCWLTKTRALTGRKTSHCCPLVVWGINNSYCCSDRRWQMSSVPQQHWNNTTLCVLIREVTHGESLVILSSLWTAFTSITSWSLQCSCSVGNRKRHTCVW